MHRFAPYVLQVVLAAVALVSVPSLAQNYPTKPIKLIVPSAAGGGYDAIGRLLADKLAVELGQPLVIDNRTGSGTVVGTIAAAQSAPDGYTLLVGGLANLAFNPGLYDKLAYNPTTDFVSVGLAGAFSYTLVARKDLPQNNLREIIEFAKANPGKLTIATAGAGTGQHIAAALLKSLAKVDILEVPYKGAQPAYSDLFGGRVDLFFDNTSTVLPFVEGKRAKAIVTSSAVSDPLVPQVPTGRDAGLPNLVLESWIGLFVPSKTPLPVLEKLRVAMTKVLQMPDVRKRLEATGIRPMPMTPTETERFVKAEAIKWPAVIRQAGIRAE